MLRRLLASFHPSHQPLMSRQSYRHELITSMTMPLAISLIEGSAFGILARKCFGVSDISFSLIMAAPTMANLTSFFWARLACGRRKIPVIALLQCLLLISISGIALIPPHSRFGTALLITLIILARCLISGILTLRSIVSRHNYARQNRATVTGRLTLITSTIFIVAPLVSYSLLDWHPDAFRIAYPVAALLASIGIIAFSRVRLRRERELLRFERQPNVEPVPHGTPGPIYEYDPKQFTPTFFSVLRNDVLFRRFMMFQFLLGGAAMMSETVIVYGVADLTKSIDRPFMTSIAITTSLPMLLGMLFMPRWARFLDRTHITRYRSLHSVWIMMANLLGWWGLLHGSLWWVAASRIPAGIFRGGGVLAWMLGHNDFADRRFAATYMGIHVTLTGLRGAIFPFIAIALYRGWPSQPTGLPIPAFEGINASVLLVTSGLALFAAAGMAWLHHTMVLRPETETNQSGV